MPDGVMTQQQLSRLVLEARKAELPTADPPKVIDLVAARGEDAPDGSPEATIYRAVSAGRNTPDLLTESEGNALLEAVKDSNYAAPR